MSAKTALETFTSVLVAIAASALIWTLFHKPEPAQAGDSPIVDVSGTIAAAHLTNAKGAGTVAVVEFADFQCPACGHFATNILPAIDKALIETGKIRYAMAHLPLTQLHPQATAAAVASECAAEQGKFWEMHDLLFEDQARLPAAEAAHFSGAVSVFGADLDQGRFEACLQADRALAKVRADGAEAARLGVNATPTLFLGRMRSDGGVDLVRQITGPISAEQLEEEVGKL